jgi:hypothetical protein
MSVKISDLPAASAALGAMQFEVNDAGTSRRVTMDQMIGYGGKVLQVVRSSATSSVSTTSTSFVDYGLSVTITPRSTSSRILVMANFTGGGLKASSAAYASFAIRKGSTVVQEASIYIEASGVTAINSEVPVFLIAQDSPATTSAVTYKLSLLSGTGANAVVFSQGSGIVEMIAMEIAG